MHIYCCDPPTLNAITKLFKNVLIHTVIISKAEFLFGNAAIIDTMSTH